MNFRLLALVPIVTIGLTFASWSLLKTTVVDNSTQAQLERIHRDAAIKESEIRKELFDLKTGRSWNFARLTQLQKELEVLMDELHTSLASYDPNFVRQTDESLISAKRNIESFKSSIAIERNSRAYLEKTIEKRLAQLGRSTENSQTVSLFRLYKLSENSRFRPSDDSAQANFYEQDLESLVAEIRNTEEKQRFERHFRLLRSTQPDIDTSFRTIGSSFAASLLPAEKVIESLRLATEQNASTSRDTAFGLLVLSIILVLVVTGLLSRVAKHAYEKENMNEELQRRVEETTYELKLKTDEAISANRLKSEFLANMSHEIRTPLNGILGLAQLLQRTDLTDKQKRHVATIRTSGDSLLAVINDILDISKIEAGLMELENENLDIAELVKQVEETVSGIASQKNIGTSSTCTLPDGSVFLGDEKKIRQVLINLAGNAVKFTDQGEVSLSVSETNDGALKFAVTDTGPGIPEDQIGKIFGRFTQADSSATRKHGGTGLGLAISKDFVNLMGGDIGVESESGKGSTFWFTLPLENVRDQNSERTRHGAPGSSGRDFISSEAHKLPGMRILIAEDNEVNREMLLEALQYIEDAQTVVVDNGAEAIRKLDEEEFDLVLMDINMPVMTGDEATRRIRSSTKPYRGIPIVVLTANAMTGQREEYLNMGANAYLAKPINIDRLISTVEQFLNKSGVSNVA